MARYYHPLEDNGDRCNRCRVNGSRLFGRRDPASRWEGYCAECNVRWYAAQFDATLRQCNRRCLVFLLRGLGLPVFATLYVRSSLAYSPDHLRHSILLKHSWRVNHLCWLSAPMDRWLEATDSEAEDDRYEHPQLRTLNEIDVISPSWTRSCFNQLHSGVFRAATLLQAVSVYLTNPEDLKSTPSRWPELFAGEDDGNREPAWQCYEWMGKIWLWNSVTEEWFYVSSPGAWQRYTYFDEDLKKYFWWCCGARWFVEPVLHVGFA